MSDKVRFKVFVDNASGVSRGDEVCVQIAIIEGPDGKVWRGDANLGSLYLPEDQADDFPTGPCWIEITKVRA